MEGSQESESWKPMPKINNLAQFTAEVFHKNSTVCQRLLQFFKLTKLKITSFKKLINHLPQLNTFKFFEQNFFVSEDPFYHLELTKNIYKKSEKN